MSTAITLTISLVAAAGAAAPAGAATVPIDLGSAAAYSAFGGSISNTGPTQLTGNAGTSPDATLTGFPSGELTGTLHAGDAAAATTLGDVERAYDMADQLVPTAYLSGDLAGHTVGPGVYNADAALSISTVLTLDAGHDAAAIFVFQVDAAFSVAASAKILLINGAQADHVFWQVQGAVTIGATSTFYGTMLGFVAITVGANATVFGRVLSISGAVTLSSNSIMPQGPVALATAFAYSALAATSVTSSGASAFSASIGTSPGVTISGFPPAISSGTLHPGDAEANQAQVDAHAAYEDAQGRTSTATLPANLNSVTLLPGVQRSVGSVALTSAVTLDGLHNPDSIFIFQINGGVSSGPSSKVRLINGADPNRIFWQITGGVTIGSKSEFAGMLLTSQSIVLGNAASLLGRALSLSGSITATAAYMDTLKPVELESATQYSALAATSINNTGSTVMNFSVGVSPGTTINGFPPGTTTDGALHRGDAHAAQAQTDAHYAYVDATRRTPTRTISGNLAGLTFLAGVYYAPAAISNSGTLYLDAQGDPNAVFIFQIGAAFTGAAESTMQLVNGAVYSRVFWQVAGAVTLGAGCTFVGTVLSNGAVTAGSQMQLVGRLVSLSGPVTLGATVVDSPIPVPGSLTATSSNTSLSSVTIDGINAQYAQGVGDGWSVADDRGTGAGWSLTISATDLVSAAGSVETIARTIPSFDLSVVGGPPLAASGSDSAANITSNSFVLSGAPQALYSSTGSTRGAYFFSPQFVLLVPALAYRSNYSGVPESSEMNPYVTVITVTIS